MQAFLSVVNTLASEERANILSNETNQVGSLFLIFGMH